MTVKRFLTGLGLGLILSFCLACTYQVLRSEADPIGPVLPSQVTVETQTLPDLPQATQALMARAGAEGLTNPPRQDLRLVVISDLNRAYGSTDYDVEVDQAISLMPLWQPDLVVCGGDMVAGQNPSLTPDRLTAMWQAFDQHVAAPLRQQGIPYGFTLGNHDASSARGVRGQYLFQKERDLASAYWLAPAHDSGLTFIDRSHFPFYYSFELGGIFFMAWDGSSSQLGPEQLTWVEQALASPTAQAAQARMVLSHLPLYAVAVGRDEPGEVLANAAQIQSLLERYRVHTVISGHHHTYYPGHRGKLQLLHAGILGSGPRPLIDSPLPTRKVVTVLDVDFDNPQLTTYTSYDMATLKTINPLDLPRFLAGHNGLILRRDVAYGDLSPTERAACIQRLGQGLCQG
ncbi:MAG: metallophosphoesterase family protein [Nodosilinea sp.]